MAGLGSLAVWFLIHWGSNAHLVDQQIAQLSPRQTAWLLPSAWRVTEPVWIVAHERSDWPKAFFAVGPGRAIGDRDWPLLTLPRLYLHRSFWDPTRPRLKSFDMLGVDQAAALLRAYLARRWQTQDAEWQKAAAPWLLAEWARAIPPEQRSAALFESALDFASHLLSVTHELARAENRGISFCGSTELPLLHWWRKSFERLDFPIFFFGPQGEDAAVALPHVIRGELAFAFLGRDWQGDPAELPLCPARSEDPRP